MSNETDAQGNDAKLKRDIGVLAAGFLVLNGVIGAGIFGLPGKLVEQAGMFGPWLIIIFGAFIITVAWTFASISSFFLLIIRADPLHTGPTALLVPWLAFKQAGYFILAAYRRLPRI